MYSNQAGDPAHTHLAFKMGMFGLEMARPPASTKPMEVKLAHQESELVTLLKRIGLGPLELQVLRERAVLLRDGKLRSRGDALLPMMLASYLFESLIANPQDKTPLEAQVKRFDDPLFCQMASSAQTVMRVGGKCRQN